MNCKACISNSLPQQTVDVLIAMKTSDGKVTMKAEQEVPLGKCRDLFKMKMKSHQLHEFMTRLQQLYKLSSASFCPRHIRFVSSNAILAM